jgi:peptidase E
MAKPRQIITLGGGGFSMEPRNTRIDDYILALTGKRRPKVCFIGTASGDSLRYIKKFYRRFPASRAIASHLPLFIRSQMDPHNHLLSQDVIYVGGGNTANMLAVWRVHGVDKTLREAWQRGIILCGVSAGMLCWFECSVTDSFGPLAALNDGLGFLAGSACPHYDGEAMRRPTYHKLVKRGFAAGVAADDFAGIHYIGRQIHQCIASRSGRGCYRVQRRGDRVIETPLPVRVL